MYTCEISGLRSESSRCTVQSVNFELSCRGGGGGRCTYRLVPGLLLAIVIALLSLPKIFKIWLK